MGWKTTLAAGALVLSIGAPASAGVIFDNFGPGDTVDGGNGWTISRGLPIGIDFDAGDAFTVSGGDQALDSIELAVSLLTGSNTLMVSVHADDAGAPGALLERVTLSDAMGMFGESAPPVVADFSGETVLEDGLQYWVIASVDDDSWAAWHMNIMDDMGPHAVRRDGGEWDMGTNRRGAFRVTGLTTPAPGALALLLLGASTRRRRRDA